jgi:membrane protein required for colicin V production
MTGLNEVDIAILSVTLLSCLFGIWRGLIKEVMSLVTWIAALVVARVYSESLAGLFANLIEGSTGRYIAAFTLLFILTMMLGTVITHFMSKLITVTGLKLVDRLFGGFFGIARGAIIVLVIMFITSVFVSETEQWQQSVLIPYGVSMIEWSRIFISDFNMTSTVQ